MSLRRQPKNELLAVSFVSKNIVLNLRDEPEVVLAHPVSRSETGGNLYRRKGHRFANGQIANSR
jgi:hypothetical protein